MSFVIPVLVVVSSILILMPPENSKSQPLHSSGKLRDWTPLGGVSAVVTVGNDLEFESNSVVCRSKQSYAILQATALPNGTWKY